MAAPPLWAGVAAAAAPKIVGIGADSLRQYMKPKPVRVEQAFVDKSAPRDGQAVAIMQQMHDQAGGVAPNLDFRSANGLNAKYVPADRQPPKAESVEVASSSSKRPPDDPGAGKIKAVRSKPAAVLPAPVEQAVKEHREAIPILPTQPERERSPPRGDRRPQKAREHSDEKHKREEANREGASYFQLRSKAMKERSSVLPREYYIGDPKNQALLDKKADSRARAAKRPAVPIEPPAAKRRGGAANPGEVAVYEARQEKQKKLRENSHLFEAADGNLKIRKPMKAIKSIAVTPVAAERKIPKAADKKIPKQAKPEKKTTKRQGVAA